MNINLKNRFLTIGILAVFCTAFLISSAVLAQAEVTSPTITTGSSLPNGKVGTSYFTFIEATGLPTGAGYAFGLTSGSLPPGIIFATCSTSVCTGLSGSPTLAGTYTFTLALTSGSLSASRQFTLTVNPTTSSNLAIITQTIPEANVGKNFSLALTTSGASSATASGILWSISPGSLPPGLSLTPCASSGCTYSNAITGIPTIAGTYTFTVNITSNLQSASKQIAMTVYAATSPIIFVTSPAPNTEWTNGQTHTVSWQYFGGTDADEAIIRLSSGSSSTAVVDAKSVKFSAGSYNFLIPADFPTGNAKLYVILAKNQNIFGMVQGYINITKLTPLTITSPNGGENWATDSAQNITWTMPEDQVYHVELYLMPQGITPVKSDPAKPVTSDVMVDPIVGGYSIGAQTLSQASSTGSYAWSIGTLYPAGIYTIRAYLLPKDATHFDSTKVLAQDDSDAAFNLGDVSISMPDFGTLGWLESISQDGNVTGWAVDSNNLKAAINVHIYFDAPAGSKGGVQPTATATDVTLDDVNQIMGTTGTHGFNVAIPDKFRDGKKHTAYVYAIDIEDATGASNAELWGSPKSFTLSLASTTRHARGTIIIGEAGTAYFLGAEIRYPFPSPEVFFSWGHKFSDLVYANSADLAMPIGPIAEKKQ